MIPTFEKIQRRVRGDIVRFTRPHAIYPWLYASTWHAKFFPGGRHFEGSAYFAAVPNPDAGIGHQMANWIAGYWFAQQFGLKFAHIPFSSPEWETLLGFGAGEVTVESLKADSYRVVRLPLFDEGSQKEVAHTRSILASYTGRKVVFLCEQDQGYRDQCGVQAAIQEKFHHAPARATDRLRFSPDCFNIAIHVRRGDIVAGQTNGNPNLQLRWLDADYFSKTLDQVLANLRPAKPIAIYLFSQGTRGDFPEFEKYQNLHWCLDWGPQESFVHLAFADLLATSKSSFSYKPALLSKGIKVCPRNFWHSYPEAPDWVLAEDDATISAPELRKLHTTQ